MGNTPSGFKSHIETAEKTGVLQLSKFSLSEFPNVTKLKNVLRTLDLTHNKIINIPLSLCDLINLKHLDLSHNRICSIPDEIGELKKLETLSLSHNKITTLPSSLNTLKNLKQVDISGNQLKYFPTQFGSLDKLNAIDLSCNCITYIPDEVEDLQVIELNVNENQISRVSPNLAKCKRLKTLRMEENCLSLNSIPIQLFTSSNISFIALDGNLFEAKQLSSLEGYDMYLERFTATKKKMF